MVNVYLTFGVFIGACAALYKAQTLIDALSSFGAKPLTVQGQPTAAGFRPLWEADGLHPFEFFGLSERTNTSTNQNPIANN